jgi:hypothetical protein
MWAVGSWVVRLFSFDPNDRKRRMMMPLWTWRFQFLEGETEKAFTPQRIRVIDSGFHVLFIQTPAASFHY